MAVNANPPIRVLQIVNGIFGGAEAVVYNYYRQMDRDKVQFDLVISEGDESEVPDDIKALGCKIYKVPSYKHVNKYISAIKQICREGNYKIVHSHMNAMGVFPLYAAKRAGVPVRIAHSHSTAGKGEYAKNLLKNTLRPFSRVYPTHYFACSEYAGRWLFGDKAFGKGEVTVIRNAIDVEKFRFNPETRARVRKDLGVEDKFVIGHVGRFMTPKNHTFLLDIFAEVLKLNKDSVLLMAGDGKLRDQAEAKVKNLEIAGNALFLGLRNDVSDLYQAMDEFVLPSLYEGLPVVGVEAQCSGLPCAFSDDITKEAVSSDATFTLPLSVGAKAWAEKVLEIAATGGASISRTQRSQAVSRNWDIKNEAMKLQNLYLQYSCSLERES